MKVYVGVNKYINPCFLDLGTSWGEWSTSRLSRFTSASIRKEARWTPEVVWTTWGRENY
jgi:hypothetical protein